MDNSIDRPEYADMPLNDRLVAANLLAAFNEACGSRDRGQMTTILRQVLTDAEADSTVDAMFANPQIYFRHVRPPR